MTMRLFLVCCCLMVVGCVGQVVPNISENVRSLLPREKAVDYLMETSGRQVDEKSPHPVLLPHCEVDQAGFRARGIIPYDETFRYTVIDNQTEVGYRISVNNMKSLRDGNVRCYIGIGYSKSEVQKISEALESVGGRTNRSRLLRQR